jgi:hypothetical protein
MRVPPRKRRSHARPKPRWRDPFKAHRLPTKTKRVVTFLRGPHKARLSLPVEKEGARILAMSGGAAFTAYVPARTWDTIQKCAAA